MLLFFYYILSDKLKLLNAVGGWLGLQEITWKCRIILVLMPIEKKKTKFAKTATGFSATNVLLLAYKGVDKLCQYFV